MNTSEKILRDTLCDFSQQYPETSLSYEYSGIRKCYLVNIDFCAPFKSESSYHSDMLDLMDLLEERLGEDQVIFAENSDFFSLSDSAKTIFPPCPVDTHFRISYVFGNRKKLTIQSEYTDNDMISNKAA